MTVPGSLTKEVVEAVGVITRPTTGKECMDLLTLAGMLLSAAVPCWGLWVFVVVELHEAIVIVRDLVTKMDERGEWKHEWD